ncbi:phosphoribosylformylglycinamidine synthase I [Candidatus Peregrinibacteria bacterium]|nr:phosphoribosylformylglycinamidine synthase I [Candidatus Peregrinibacteria bacterium]
MTKIAIIQFPGLNTEYETRREINRCGMKGEFFRWNDDREKLKEYDGYVIGGGFSYEDRGRAGVIASLDPIMDVIKAEAAKGKPVLGICNGAQILVESGLIPGATGNKLAMALARNKRIKDGEVLGTGYFNTWTHFKCVAKKGTCMFTWNMHEGEILNAPIAHGEGRFTSDIAELMHQLQDKGQMVFRYCDKAGVMLDNFPVNPNGAMFNLAAVCNPTGNVMGVMPHLERDSVASEKLFTSMRDAIEAQKSGDKKRTPHLIVKTVPLLPLKNYEKPANSLQMNVSLIITDNESETHEMALKRMGRDKVGLKRTTHVELEYKVAPYGRSNAVASPSAALHVGFADANPSILERTPLRFVRGLGLKGRFDLQKTLKKLIQSGVLLNTNKEVAKVQFPKETLIFDAKKEKFVAVEKNTAPADENVVKYKLLVREKPDFVGLSKLSTIQKRLKFAEITGLKTGTLWEISIPTKSKKVAEEEFKKIVNTHLFFNPHRQEAVLFS